MKETKKTGGKPKQASIASFFVANQSNVTEKAFEALNEKLHDVNEHVVDENTPVSNIIVEEVQKVPSKKRKQRTKKKKQSTGVKSTEVAEMDPRFELGPHAGGGIDTEDEENSVADADVELVPSAVVVSESSELVSQLPPQPDVSTLTTDNTIDLTTPKTSPVTPVQRKSTRTRRVTPIKSQEPQHVLEGSCRRTRRTKSKETASSTAITKDTDGCVAKLTYQDHCNDAGGSNDSTRSPLQMETLDPVVQARITSYQQKVEQLTHQCARLMQPTVRNDTNVLTLQEIYGFGLDCGLDETSHNLDMIRSVWQTLKTASEFPLEVKRFLAQRMQGRNTSLSTLITQLVSELQGDLEVSTPPLMLEMEIKMIAQRTAHGSKSVNANVYEDTSVEALWCWEVGNLDLYFSESAQKIIKRMRKQRKRVAMQLKALNRVMQLLTQRRSTHSPSTVGADEAKISQEEAKIGKFVSLVESELLKAQDRVRKEQAKATAADEKKLRELEKQQIKGEEKRKRELEEEAEKLLSAKRRKSLVSYFKSIDTQEDTKKLGGINLAGGTCSTTTDCAKMESVEDGVVIGTKIATQEAKMALMDATIDYLAVNRSNGEIRPTPPSSDDGNRSLFQRHRALVTAVTGAWSCRRRRDSKLGIMKLLQFNENVRPAYYGTFSKRSRVFRRGRRPFAQFNAFDYENDSEEEWEEEEPGESLSSVESGDEDSDEDQLDYGDDWLAYEDEIEYEEGVEIADEDGGCMGSMMVDGDDGFESLDDPREVDDIDRVKMNKRRVDTHQHSRKRGRRVAAENKRQKLTKLEPCIIGPYICLVRDCTNHFSNYRGEMFVETPSFESTLMTKAKTRDAEETAKELERETKMLEKKKAKELKQQQKLLSKGQAPSPPKKTQSPTLPMSSLVKQKSPSITCTTKRRITPQLASSPLVTTSGMTVMSPIRTPPRISTWLKSGESSATVAENKSETLELSVAPLAPTILETGAEDAVEI